MMVVTMTTGPSPGRVLKVNRGSSNLPRFIKETLLLVEEFLGGNPDSFVVTLRLEHLGCTVLHLHRATHWSGDGVADRPSHSFALETKLVLAELGLLAAGVGDLGVIHTDYLCSVEHSVIFLLLKHLPLHCLALVLTCPNLLTFIIDLPQGVAQLLRHRLGHLSRLFVGNLLVLGFALLGHINLLNNVNIDQIHRAVYWYTVLGYFNLEIILMKNWIYKKHV